jgi:hypothetical protein
MTTKSLTGFVKEPTVVTEPEQVLMDLHGVQFADSRINYDDVVSVLYNTSVSDGAIVVLNLRSSSNSLVSGLPQYKLLEFDFKDRAAAKVPGFINVIKERKIPLSETAYSSKTFSKVFAA